MYIITNAKDIYLYNSPTAEKIDGGILVDKGTLVWGDSASNFYELADIPEGITPFKYCYTPEKGFYKNRDWNDSIAMSKDDYNTFINNFKNSDQAIAESTMLISIYQQQNEAALAELSIMMSSLFTP